MVYTVLIQYRFMDGYERMNLLKESEFDRYFNLLGLSMEEGNRIARCLMYAAYFHGCILIVQGQSERQWWFLHRAAKYGNDLQLTTWDEYGPVSDTRIRQAKDLSHLMTGEIAVGTEKSC